MLTRKNMKRTPILILKFAVCLLFLSACNPFPRKDTHPELPFLGDLLKDSTKFKRVIDTKDITTVAFLKDDRILLKPGYSNLPFKIIDINGKVIVAQKYDWKVPFYLDKKGNLYFNRERYDYPDYEKHTGFKTVVFQDSIDKKSEALGSQFADSIKFKMLDDYEVKLLQPFGLKPCEYQIVNTDECDVFEIKNNALLVRQVELYKNDFVKASVALEKFDKDVLIRWQNSRVAYPVYLAYYQVDNYKFKCEDTTLPRSISLKGQKYLFTYDYGLFLIK